MRRRDFIALAGGMAVVRPFTAQPPPPTVLNMGMGRGVSHQIAACGAAAMTASGPLKTLAGLATIMIVQLCATGAAALPLTLFRYEDQAQQHCPADTVVWLDFKKGKYYLSGQKLYGHGFHGSYVCLQEARRSQYRRSLLGRR